MRYEIRSKITTGYLESYARLRAAAVRAERLEKEKESGSQGAKTEYKGESSSRPGKRKSYSQPSYSGTRGGFRGGSRN